MSSCSAKTTYSERLKELVEADVSTSVFVEVANHLRHFCLGELQTIVVEALHEFITIQRSATVVIHDAKCSEQHEHDKTLPFLNSAQTFA